MSFVLAEEVCAPRSSFSHSATDRPRPAASRAMPAPLMPPPTISRSKLSGDRAMSVSSGNRAGTVRVLTHWIADNAYPPRVDPEACFAVMKHPRSVLSGTTAAGITRYLQLYRILAQSLADGEYKSAQALPSEPALVARFRVSRTTVRRALFLLAQEGRIVRRRGSGTYAKMSRAHTTLSFDLPALYSDAPAVPKALQAPYPDLGPRALAIRCMQAQHGEPFQLAVTYVPDATAQRYAIRRSGRAGNPVGLEKLARRVRTVEQATTAAAADA